MANGSGPVRLIVSDNKSGSADPEEIIFPSTPNYTLLGMPLTRINKGEFMLKYLKKPAYFANKEVSEEVKARYFRNTVNMKMNYIVSVVPKKEDLRSLICAKINILQSMGQLDL